MSCFIHKPLALGSRHRNRGALRIIDPKLGAGVHAEVELSQVLVKVLLVHVLLDADETALEDAEVVFKGVGVNVTTRPLVLGVVNGFVLHDLKPEVLRAVGDMAAVLMQMFRGHAADVLVIEVHGAYITVALNEAEDLRRRARIQRQPFGLAGLRRLREIGFVGFQGHARAAQRACIRPRSYCMANPVPDEPCGFHAATEHALELAGADAFLRRAHQEDRLKPKMHRDVAVLKDGPDLHGELLAALIALAKSRTGRFAREAPNTTLVVIAAVRADRAMGPKLRLCVVVGGLLILEVRGVQIRVHGAVSGMSGSCAGRRGWLSVTPPDRDA